MWPRAHLKRDSFLGTARPCICGARSLGGAQMSARETKKQHTEEKAVRKLTAAELAAIDKFLVRLEAKPSARFRVSKDGSNWQIGFDHPDQLVGRALVMDALASADGGLSRRRYVPTRQRKCARSGH